MFREIHGPSTDVHDIDVLADVLSSGDRFKKCHGSLAQVKALAKKIINPYRFTANQS